MLPLDTPWSGCFGLCGGAMLTWTGHESPPPLPAKQQPAQHHLKFSTASGRPKETKKCLADLTSCRNASMDVNCIPHRYRAIWQRQDNRKTVRGHAGKAPTAVERYIIPTEATVSIISLQGLHLSALQLEAAFRRAVSTPCKVGALSIKLP